MITLQKYHPVNLSQIVKSFWCLKVSGPAENLYREDIIPDGHQEIIFLYEKNTAKRNTPANTWINEPDSFFAGQTLRSYSLEIKNNSLLYGIRFYPHTLNRLFKFPANLITNTVLSLNEIKEAGALRNCIKEDPQLTFTNLELALTKLLRGADFASNNFKCVQHSVSEIMKQQGNIKIEKLVSDSGFSLKYFDTLFKQQVGITPKAFSNIIKLNNFISYRNTHPLNSLTACAYEANYFDQSHLIKLFKEATGKSPKEYFINENYINNYFLKIY
jgi:AraC-like DNA-binding protein